MSKNMGYLDKTLRIVVAAVVGILYLSGLLPGAAATLLGILAVIFIATGFIGFCPLYGLCGVSTNRSETKTKEGVAQ